jgi:hypothetical protein
MATLRRLAFWCVLVICGLVFVVAWYRIGVGVSANGTTCDSMGVVAWLSCLVLYVRIVTTACAMFASGCTRRLLSSSFYPEFGSEIAEIALL